MRRIFRRVTPFLTRLLIGRKRGLIIVRLDVSAVDGDRVNEGGDEARC